MKRAVTPRRRWPYRLAESSPLVAIAFALLVWLSLPLTLALALLSTGTYAGAYDVGDEVAFWIDGQTAMNRREAIGLTFIGGPESMSSEVWSNIAGLYAVDATPTVLEDPMAPDDAVFEPILEWEREYDGSVWAWTVLPPEMPPVVAVGVGTTVTSAQLDEALAAGAIADRLDFEPMYGVAGLWRKTFVEPYGDGEPALDAQWFINGWGISALGADWQASTFTAGDEAWVALWHGAVSGSQAALPTIPGLGDADPHAPGFADEVQQIAERNGLDIWVLGPLESRALPLRIPEGATEEDAAALADLVWPGLYIRSNTAFLSSPVGLTDAETAITGGVAGMIEVGSVIGSPEYSGLGWTLSKPQSIAFLYVTDTLPGGAETAFDRAWHSWRIFLGHNFRLFVAISSVLVLLSCAIALAAFTAERRMTVRERASEERQRLHRDAHDKVYNRLSALSKRVAAVSAEAINGTADDLGTVAEDIRGTVSELQEILGDDVQHASSALASVGLSEQIASVCGAQSARLKVDVSCTVDAGVVGVSPDLGWDLQCIVEEAITNAVRHGRAAHVVVSVLPAADGGLLVTVADDGSGSDVTDLECVREGSTGLKGMLRRAERHGGTLGIANTGHGSVVTVRIPSDEKA